VVTKKKDECVKKQWILYTNKAGEKVPVRDALSKVVDWIDRFKQCVDVAVQYDPGQAALPWVAVRALLQVRGLSNVAESVCLHAGRWL
jgi:hypothetical protein